MHIAIYINFITVATLYNFLFITGVFLVSLCNLTNVRTVVKEEFIQIVYSPVDATANVVCTCSVTNATSATIAQYTPYVQSCTDSVLYINRKPFYCIEENKAGNNINYRSVTVKDTINTTLHIHNRRGPDTLNLVFEGIVLIH